MVNPTGHVAVYFQRICADTPVRLRRCRQGELGAVIARYQGIDGYDWIAIPLVPYLYSVENTSHVPAHVDHEIVVHLRNNYREAHLESLGEKSRAAISSTADGLSFWVPPTSAASMLSASTQPRNRTTL